MKKEIIIIEVSNEVKVNSFEDLTKLKYVGFENYSGKYMLMTSGKTRGFAVKPWGTWTSLEKQKTAEGKYFLFDTANELLEWMKD